MRRINHWTESEGASRVEELFTSAFGSPTHIAAAPGRVNLIGEHTDYNAGLCLPIALPMATYAAAAARDDDQVRIVSGETDQPWQGNLDELAGATGWAAYAAGVIWALREAGLPAGGIDLAVTGCVPLGAGLSSSAALECAVGTVVQDILGAPDPAVLVAAGIRAESEVAGAPTGGMDQTVSVFAAAGSALLIDCESGARELVPFDLAEAGLALAVVDSKVNHALGDGGYASRRADCEAAVAALGVRSLRRAEPGQLDALCDERIRRRARHVVTEIDRVQQAVDSLAAKDFAAFGELMWASHASMRDDFEISTEELDLIVEVARECGALGARMTGGGFGGSAIALLDVDRIESFFAAVSAAYVARDWPTPDGFVATAEKPARVLLSPA